MCYLLLKFLLLFVLTKTHQQRKNRFKKKSRKIDENLKELEFGDRIVFDRSEKNF